MKSNSLIDAFAAVKFFWLNLIRKDAAGYEELAIRIYSGAGVAFLTQLAGYTIAYLANIFYARWMGATEYGLFSYISAWTLLLATLAALEFPTVLLRFASEYAANSDWPSLLGLLKTSRLVVFLSGTSAAAIATLFALFLYLYSGSIYAAPLAVGAWIIPLWSMVYLHTAMGRVFEKIVIAYAPPRVLKPLLLMMFGAIYISTGRALTGTALLCGTIISLIVVLGIQWLSLEKHPISAQIRKTAFSKHTREWFQVAFNVLLVSGVFIVLQQTNTLLLGIFLAPDQVALYSAAAKTTQLMNMPALAMSAYAVPMFAILYAQKDLSGLQKVLSRTVAWSFWPSVIGAVVLAAGASFFLGLFGSAFKAATPAVIVLALGALVIAGGGPVLMLLQVTGYQAEAARVIAISASVGFLFSIAGIYFLGITGAALATVATSVLWVTWLNWLAGAKIGVYPSVLYTLKKQKPS